MGAIDLDGLTKRFGEVLAVDGVDASIAEGTYTMILGPSGSGKSTLLRMVAGLETPTEGDVVIDGEVVTDRPARERDLSMVFQSLALWDHKTVRENMAFGLRMDGVDADTRRQRVRERAELLEIDDKLDATPDQLSGGQQQRVALGRSLVREPAVILLDEPLSSLDQRLRLRMRTELKRIQQETGTTFVHVTHNQEDAMTVADEIMLVNEGRVEQFARPLDLYHHPANEFVADFIGSPSMNLFDATFDPEGDDGRPAIASTDGTVRLAIPDAEAAPFRDQVPAGAVRVGVRPEALTFAAADGASTTRSTSPSADADPAAPRVAGTVSVVETFGDYAWYYVDVGLEEDVVVQSNDETVMESVGVGTDVGVVVPPAALHTFDPDTGEAFGTATASRPRSAADAVH
jgi:multiple sugar transport system ATP-binding protein